MRSWCFDSIASENDDGEIVYDREYGSAELREVVRAIVGNGIYGDSSTNMQVLASNGMDITVQPGACWILGAYGVVDAAETLTVATNTGTNTRVDKVVARFDLSVDQRSIRLAIIEDNAALTRNDSTYDLQLAKINVRGGATSITQSDITDTRFDKNVCGIVTGAISQINTTTLFEQYQAQFNSFMDNLDTNLSEDAAGNLLLRIEEVREDSETAMTDHVNNYHGLRNSRTGTWFSASCEFKNTSYEVFTFDPVGLIRHGFGEYIAFVNLNLRVSVGGKSEVIRNSQPLMVIPGTETVRAFRNDNVSLAAYLSIPPESEEIELSFSRLTDVAMTSYVIEGTINVAYIPAVNDGVQYRTGYEY